MAAIVGLVLIVIGIVGVTSGLSIEDHAESAFHQIFAATQYAGGMIVAALGCIMCAIGSVSGRLKRIDESLRAIRIEAERQDARESPETATDTRPALSNEWKCPSCGRVNPKSSWLCNCGQRNA